MKILSDEELVEKCMPTLERFEQVEKDVFFPIPKPVEFSATIRIYASTLSREAVRKTLRQVRDLLDGIENPYDADSYMVVPEYMQEGFNRAIQTIKALLEE